jgi:hypothetical protein
MEIVQTKQFSRTKNQETATIPIAKGQETSYPFQWLLFKPQLHAVEPFEINKASRNDNTARSETRTHADFSKGSPGMR